MPGYEITSVIGAELLIGSEEGLAIARQSGGAPPDVVQRPPIRNATASECDVTRMLTVE